MSSENTSRSMRYYTIEYNRILHRLIYSAGLVPRSKSVGGGLVLQIIPLLRAGAAMSANVRKYSSELSVRQTANEISALSAKTIHELQSVHETAEAVVSTDDELLRFEKSILCINNSLFSDMSEFVFDSSIEHRYIREMQPFCRALAEMAALSRRFVVCEGLRQTMLSFEEQICRIIDKVEGISMDMGE